MKKQLIFEDILPEMFSRVGQVYTPDFVKQPEWYLTYTWSPEVEEAFRKWLVALFRKKGCMTVRMATESAGWFLLSYGWKTEA